MSTAASMFFRERREEFAQAAANRALSAMRKGALLHLEYRNGRPSWSLGGGRAVSAEVANILTHHALVAPAGDALFPGMPAQVWRYNQ